MSDLPRYGLAMIVKNGADDLPRTLAAARPYIGYYVISDTGSTDDTMAIIRRELKGIPGVLREDPFVDFGHNRSIVFAEIRNKCRWALLMDADMAVEMDEEWEPDPALDAYMIEMGRYTPFSYRLPLLVRGDIAWRSVGAVHEYTWREDGLPYRSEPTDAVRVDMTAADRSSPEKFRWHLAMLMREWRRDRTNQRTAFYLAQTFRSLGKTAVARRWYLRRAGMAGYAEEAFYSAYQAALLAPDWPTRAVELMAAWERRPGRLEPLYDLAAELNRRDMHHAAYALASVGAPLPADSLFVSTWVWDWGVTFERSVAAYWVGRRDECRELCDRLLENPRVPTFVRAQVLVNRKYTTEEAA